VVTPQQAADRSEPKIVKPQITWNAGAVDPRAAAALGDEDARQRATRSPVPVLAPTNVTLEKPTLIVEGEYYALTGRVHGATIAIQGTRAQHRYEGIEPAQGNRMLRGQRGFVSVNEGIRTSSWMENGASYTVDVECAEHTDVRCKSDTFVVSIVEHLANAGGSGR
jgi:hypothetical protein